MRRGPSRRGRRAHDVAVYAPSGSLYYGPKRDYMGGAEVQATMLAHALKAKGLRVAHVVYPVPEPRRVDASSPTLVERSEWQGDRRLGQLAETGAIWRCLQRADAEAYIVRGSGGHVIAAGTFCRARGRRFVFSSSSELDFDFARPDRNPRMLQIYKASLRLAARLALQTEAQRELALRALPHSDPVVIPSFAEPAPSANGSGEYFLWVDRLVEYKLPDRYVELAEALPDARFRMIASRDERDAPRHGRADRGGSRASPQPRAAPAPSPQRAARGDAGCRGARQDVTGRGHAQRVPRGLGPRCAGAVAERRPRREDREQRHRRGDRRVDGALDRGSGEPVARP